MNISFENPDKINGLMTIVVEEADYKEEVEKALKDYRKRANIPGFRPGQVPMGLIKRQFGTQLKMDAVNKLLGENLQKYIADNKIQMLGQPMASEKQDAVDLEKEAPYTFMFDIAVAPEFKAALSGKDKVAYYEIEVDDKMIDQQVEMFQSRAGHYDKVEEFDADKRDMLKGDLRELDANGNTLEGIAVAPEFKAALSGKDKVAYYEIEVDDKMIDQQVEMFQSRAGHYDKVEEFDADKRDMLKGDLRELDANGNTLEGGLTIEGASLMPQYIKVEDQKNLFNGAKLGDIITWNPCAAYPENDAEVSSLLKIKKEEVAEHTGNFSYQITEISRFVNAENNKELWVSVYGEDAKIEDEAAFRKHIADGLAAQLEGDSNYKFIQDVRTHMEKKVGKLAFPDELLKRIMLANNQEKGAEFVERTTKIALRS